ncbi:glycosyltransferase family 39 protein [Caproicibacter fermentans]|uniref:Glycosyltransferase family 39 protein n=1 Tax=Caproicibacter fermentans TaxID=2576756 RepID=A0A7G8T918_9FIRM|nr:glycosyltransferase family 39 protein [Caproicibacter fermentans]QNK40109.1 glycosyltransferase family 39 protein [Caproicibacter fermentans]
MKTVRKYREAVLLSLILLLAAFLSVYNIWNLGYGNEFYAASVKSMLTGWKNFFFASLDPGGWITVDKPPVSLWVQTAFAKVFGFYGWSIILPQCLAAVATAAIIYHVVKRHFGSAAGLISALVLALSPIFIVVSKTNNTDSVLIFFMVLSAWAMMAASDRGQLRCLILSMVFLGIAYNAKTLEAFLILPALYAVYFFGTKIKWRKRIWHLAVATLVLLVVSLSWSVAVDLTPASERPYVDNSTNNSELELALGYNGIQRITGQNRGSSGSAGTNGEMTSPPGMTDDGGQPGQPGEEGTSGGAQDGQISMSSPSLPDQTSDGTNGTEQSGDASSRADGRDSTDGGGFEKGGANGFAGGPGGNGGGGGMFNGGGSAGLLRMFNTTLGGQDSWLLPFGAFSALAMLLGMRNAEEERRRKLLRGVLMWGGSVVTMVGYFSVSEFFHPYYISAMAPFLAALTGIGAVELWKLYRRGGASGWLLPAAFASTLAVQAAMLVSYQGYSKILIPLICAVTGIPAVLLVALRAFGKNTGGTLAAACVTLGFAGLLIAPAVWTGYSVFSNQMNTSIPSAGPSAEGASMFGQGGGGRQWSGGNTSEDDRRDGRTDTESQDGGTHFGGSFGNQESSSSDSALISFLEQNNTGEKYLVAVQSASEAEPIILATGKPVMAVGGFSGTNRSLTVEKLEQMVKSGELKYYLVGGRGGMSGDSSDEVTKWVEEHGTAVDSTVWSSSSGSGMEGGGSQTLYDLSGYQKG